MFRKAKEKIYGVSSFKEAAIKHEQKPICPRCISLSYTENVYTPAKHKRYKCLNCEHDYTLLSNSILILEKLHFVN